MNQRLIAEIGRTQRLEILNSLKRTRGMSVNELVERMKMSYMGIKQHCLTLQREGYMAQFTTGEGGGPQILECHSPIMNLLEQYPIIGRLEQDMFEVLLGTRVRREMIRNSGLYECAFYFAL